MDNENLLPSSLVTCLLDNQEVKILKISFLNLVIRSSEVLNNKPIIKLAFYKFKENTYKEVVIKNYTIIEEKKEKFFFTYNIEINDNEYKNNVNYIFDDYSKYVMLKQYGDENQFSKEMVGYPAEREYEFYNCFSDQKKELMSKINNQELNVNLNHSFELAISLDNNKLYKKYLETGIESFKKSYYKENYFTNKIFRNKKVGRIYIGNEVCHNLFPSEEQLMKMLEKSLAEKIDVSLCFTYMRDNYIDKTAEILDKVYRFCKENNKSIEVVKNDWGMLKLVKSKEQFFKTVLGVLLNKRKKDPRYKYKNGIKENKKLIMENSLNSKVFLDYLHENNINRFEFENCGYRMNIPKGRHSLHIPFYVTNTSQYCTLYAMCKNNDRGKQKLVVNCPEYCNVYVFLYPKHLKMIGKYNSLFAFDDTLLNDTVELEYYLKNGIDRIVLNFL